jgi:hypothetical protein
MFIVIRTIDNKHIVSASSFKKIDDYFKLRRSRRILQDDLLNKVLFSKKYNINIKIIKNEEKWQKQQQIIFLVKLESS